jgi:SnoaL-like domain
MAPLKSLVETLPRAKDSEEALTSARGDVLTNTGQQGDDELLEQIRHGEMFGDGTVLDGPEGIEQMVEVLRVRAHPEFVTVMTSESAMPTEWAGIEGFREALSDWISPYESFRLEIDEAIVEEDKLVFLARQVATTKHGGVEVETESATIWWLEEGLIRRAVFYLDQKEALKVAGIDPDRHSGD